MSKSAITQKQRLVLEFIQSYMDKFERSPFIREIQTGCQITSYKSVVDRLNALERKGFIKRESNKHRGIALAKGLPKGAVKEPAMTSEKAQEIYNFVAGPRL